MDLEDESSRRKKSTIGTFTSNWVIEHFCFQFSTALVVAEATMANPHRGVLQLGHWTEKVKEIRLEGAF